MLTFLPREDGTMRNVIINRGAFALICQHSLIQMKIGHIQDGLTTDNTPSFRVFMEQ